MMIISVLLSTIAGLIKSFTPNYVSYVIMEFLDTAIGSGMYSAAYILGTCIKFIKYTISNSIIINL